MYVSESHWKYHESLLALHVLLQISCLANTGVFGSYTLLSVEEFAPTVFASNQVFFVF